MWALLLASSQSRWAASFAVRNRGCKQRHASVSMSGPRVSTCRPPRPLPGTAMPRPETSRQRPQEACCATGVVFPLIKCMGRSPVDAIREALLDEQRASPEFKHSLLADELKSSKPYVNIYKRRCPDTPSAAGLGCPDLNSLGLPARESQQRGGTARGQWRSSAQLSGTPVCSRPRAPSQRYTQTTMP